jgi:hypothetical protein
MGCENEENTPDIGDCFQLISASAQPEVALLFDYGRNKFPFFEMILTAPLRSVG